VATATTTAPMDTTRPDLPNLPPAKPFTPGAPVPTGPPTSFPGAASAPPSPAGGLDAPLGTTTWRPDPPSKSNQPASGSSGKLYGIVALVVALAAGWWLYGTITAEKVPESIASYADGTTGVTHQSVAGYSVRLPGPPMVETLSAPVLGITLRIDMAVYEDLDMMAGVMVMDLPPGSGLNPDLILDGGAMGIDSVGGATVKSQTDTTHQGHAALDMEVEADGASGHFRMVIVGDRAYVAVAATPGPGGDTAFDALTESLVIGTGA
jgi:hypothetical protein